MGHRSQTDQQSNRAIMVHSHIVVYTRYVPTFISKRVQVEIQMAFLPQSLAGAKRLPPLRQAHTAQAAWPPAARSV